jgi:hypothetical protein
MLEPREREEHQHNENDQALFGGSERENAEEPFHLLA